VTRVLVVSGTGTGVGKTVVTAAIAALPIAAFPDPLSPEAAALDASVVVVAAAGLGTLNHTALTLEALAARKLAPAGVVIGSWPRQPGMGSPSALAALAPDH